MIRAILFDFNGVIINDEPLQLKAYQETLRPAGISLTERDYYAALGMDDVTFVRTAFERAGRELDDETRRAIIERKTELHRELIRDELPLFPGVVTFVKACARHFLLGIVSMARRTEVVHVLERAALDREFDIIVSAEDVSACKPNPNCYKLARQRLNEKLVAEGDYPLGWSECLAIEDAPPGIEAARAVGMRTLGVTNTVSEEALRAAHADIVTGSLADWTTDAIRHVFSKG